MTLTSARPRTDWEAVIGLEVHAQLLTSSKMFCGCPAEYVQGEPNTRVCPVCLGMPGVLPVINRQAVEFVMMTGLALNCTIASYTQFDRKNYPYPDLMKGYQISQYDNPIASGGWLDLDVDGERRRVGVTRVHLEEDVAKLQHVRDGSGEAYSLVDVNRAGVPLMETVSEPDMRSPEEARQYLLAFRSILQYLGVSTADMEKGAFRCDANVSVRPVGSTELTSKVEVKNMNSFRSVFHALEYEVERQVAVLEDGGRVVQETRGWSEDRAATVSQRTKEYAHDYRYFPEPDLPPLAISREWVEEVRARLPQLPAARRDRFTEQYGLSLYDASHLTASKDMADFFEDTLSAGPAAADAQHVTRQGRGQLAHRRGDPTAERRRDGDRRQQGDAPGPRGARGPDRGRHRGLHPGQGGLRGDVPHRRVAAEDRPGEGAWPRSATPRASPPPWSKRWPTTPRRSRTTWAARRPPSASWWAR